MLNNFIQYLQVSLVTCRLKTTNKSPEFIFWFYVFSETRDSKLSNDIKHL